MLRKYSNILKVHLYILFVLVPLTTLFAQYEELQRFSVYQNSGSAIQKKKIYVDHEGFVWYSTFNGVVREIGEQYMFYDYLHPEEDEIEITNDIHLTKDNVLWVATNRGILVVNLHSGERHWILRGAVTQREYRTEFISLFYHNETMWVGGKSGAFYAIDPNLTITEHTLQNTYSDLLFSGTTVVMDYIEGKGYLVYSNGDWYLFNKETHTFLFSSEEDIESDTVLNMTKSSFFFVDKGLFSGVQGTYMYEGTSFPYRFVPEIEGYLVELPFYMETSPSKLNKELTFWVNQDSTVQSYGFVEYNDQLHLKRHDSIPFKKAPWSYHVTPEKDLYTISEDGISVFARRPDYFERPLEYFSESIGSRSLAKTGEGRVYHFSHSGFFVKDELDKPFRHMGLFQNSSSKEESHHLGHFGLDFLVENDSIMWLYGFGPDLKRINIPQRTYSTTPKLDEISNPALVGVFKVKILNDREFLVAGAHGFKVYDKMSGIYKDSWDQWPDYDFKKNGDIYDFIFTKERNAIWVATSNRGLYYRDLKSGVTIHFSKNDPTYPLAENNVRCLYEDVEGNIWAGTRKGLQRIDPKTMESVNISAGLGFKNEHITGFLEDEAHLWVGTYDGLVRLNKESLKFREYFEYDGIANNEFNVRSIFKENDTTFYFGGVNGLTRFNPRRIETNSRESKLLVTEIVNYTDDNKQGSVVRFGLDTLEKLVLPYRNNYVSFRLAINDLIHYDKCVYQYRIPELSTTWRDLGGFNELELQGLQSGEYNLQFRGFDASGMPTNRIEIPLEVKQVFYKTNLFLGLVLFSILLAVMLWHYYRRKMIHRKFLQEGEIRKLENKALRAQMNPHFIYNAINGLQGTSIVEGPEATNKYIDSFAQVLRSTLNMSHAESITLEEEIDYLKAYIDLESSKQEMDFGVTIRTQPDDLETKDILLPCMLVQPVVENAIQHGLSLKQDEDRKLDILFEVKEDQFIICVQDNGIGRLASRALKKEHGNYHESHANRIMNERLKIINDYTNSRVRMIVDDLYEGEKPMGTKVTITLPHLTAKRGVV